MDWSSFLWGLAVGLVMAVAVLSIALWQIKQVRGWAASAIADAKLDAENRLRKELEKIQERFMTSAGRDL